MTAALDDQVVVFRPRRSRGYISLLVLAGAVLLPPLVTAISLGPRPIAAVVLAPAILLAVPILALAMLFPTMRYELSSGQLRARYGPILVSRVPLAEITSIRRRDLAVTMWSAVRVPGLALFDVPYAGIGRVRMCSTSASERVLVIETAKTRYGITPQDEDAFVREIHSRLSA